MSSAQSNASAIRGWLITALKLVVSAGLLTLLFRTSDVSRLWATARNASLAWMATALLFYFLNVVLSVWRWQFLLSTQDVRMPSRQLWSSLLVALFFNNFLPS